VSQPGSDLAVSRRVILDVVRLAASETPGVARVGRSSRWRRIVGGRPIAVRVGDGSVSVTVHVVARADVSLPATAEEVRGAVAGAIERVLGLKVGSVTVVVDGVRG